MKADNAIKFGERAVRSIALFGHRMAVPGAKKLERVEPSAGFFHQFPPGGLKISLVRFQGAARYFPAAVGQLRRDRQVVVWQEL